MVKIRITLAIVILIIPSLVRGQSFPPKDNWYNNPLGFSPIDLHTKNGFLIPAAAVGICLLATQADSTLIERISFYNETGVSWGYKYPYSLLTVNTTGINFLIRKWLSIGVDFSFYLPRDSYNNAFGLAVRPFARFYPVNNDSWRLFFESGGGFIYFTEEFPKPTNQDPRLGTKLNGTTRYGLGCEINFSSRFSILFGLRHIHVSNGNTSGAERNPSHDSNGFFAGISFVPDLIK